MRVAPAENQLRILLIEDNKGDALLIEKALNIAMPSGYVLERATTLNAALDIVSEQCFEIALLDRSLPDVEGFDGLHSIQNMSPQLPIVFLTAYRDENTAYEAIEQGAQDYLFKDKIDGLVIKRAIQYAILRKQFEEVLITRANFDMLTGLANRNLFESRLEMALERMKRHGGNLAVLFLDLDRFKQVNDIYGHAAGDALLKDVAARIQSTLRPYDTAARFGGDEFAVLLESIPEIQHSEHVAEKIIEQLAAPFIIANEPIHIGVSIGIATETTGQLISSEELMKQADGAMYQAKEITGNTYQMAPMPLMEQARAVAL